MIGDVGGEQPIVRAVLEEVPQRHRSMREAVHEDGLQETLRIVDAITDGRNAAIKGNWNKGHVIT